MTWIIRMAAHLDGRVIRRRLETATLLAAAL